MLISRLGLDDPCAGVAIVRSFGSSTMICMSRSLARAGAQPFVVLSSSASSSNLLALQPGQHCNCMSRMACAWTCDRLKSPQAVAHSGTVFAARISVMTASR
jgi:hypothetical protein